MNSTFTTSIILSLAGCLAALICNVFLMLAIGKDCEARKNPKTTKWMILTFFFGSVVGIVYLVKRNKIVSEFEPDEKLEKTSKKLFAVAVVFFAVAIALSGASSYFSNDLSPFDDNALAIEHYAYDVDGQTTYYDRNGQSYIDVYEVMYYDKNGTAYLYMLDDDGYPCFSNNTTEEQISSYNCYVDKSGYFIIDESEKITVDIDETADAIRYFDENKNEYFPATLVSWDAEGNLIDSETGKRL